MPKNSFLKAKFSGPKFSIAPIEKNNRGTLRIGEVVPVFATVLNPRESIELDLASLVRFMPTKAPTMEGYKVTIDAFAVPYSTLGYAERKERDIDDFFNIKENGGEVANPFCRTMEEMCGSFFQYGSPSLTPDVGDNRMYLAFKTGSLGDYINFPSLKNVRNTVRKWLAMNPLASDNGIERYITSENGVYPSYVRLFALGMINQTELGQVYSYQTEIPVGNDVVVYYFMPFSTEDVPILPADSREYESNTGHYWNTYIDDVFGAVGIPGAYSLFGYILRNYPAVASYYGFDAKYIYDADSPESFMVYLGNHADTLNYNYLEVLYENYKIDAQSIFNEYMDYILSIILYNYTLEDRVSEKLFDFTEGSEGLFLPTLKEDEPIDLSYLAAYWKIISDWYINTNIDGNPEDFFLENCRLFVADELSSRPDYYLNLKPFTRRWANDIFTSAVPQAMVENVRIPADGTIPDLREANAYQKLVDIFRNTGSRLRDVIYGVFGITPSAVRSEMSEPIGTQTSWIGIQSVLQTSQTTAESAQANYAGVGTDSQGYKRILKYVNNAEPTPVIIMVLMSVTQRASYMQGFDRKFFRKSIYDFAVPELAMIGEQEITNKEIYFDKGYESDVFGFNRRYYDWFFDGGSEVHGELRDSLDYWHGARIFDEQPLLNSEFIGIEAGADHLQRVFANISEDSFPIVYNLSFHGCKVVALPRYIQYEL